MYFMELWKKQKENPEGMNLKDSSNPTRKDLVLMTEDLKPKNYDSAAKEESEDDVNQTRYVLQYLLMKI